jgi:general secretion pathway protein G
MPVKWLGRRRRVVVGGFQLRYVLTSLLGLFVHVVLASAVIVGPLVYLVNRDAPSGTPGWAATSLLALHEHFWPGLGLLFLLEAARVVFMSHRIAGPIYRFRVVLERLAQGDLTQRVRIRDHDYLWDEARALETAIAALRERVDATKAAAADVVRQVATLRGESLDERVAPGLDASLARLDETLDALVTDRTGRTASASIEAAAPVPVVPAPGSGPAAATRDERGMSLVEMLVTSALLGTLLALALPYYWGAVEKARVTRAIGEIYALDRAIQMFRNERGHLPETLAEVASPPPIDPWGHPYEYLRIDTSGTAPSPSGPGKGGGGGNVTGQARKDRNLVPINADFDLYSVGRDGKSASPLTAKVSQDDVVRANSGGFIGLARDY